jgi:serine/threonine protein phosphatase 1
MVRRPKFLFGGKARGIRGHRVYAVGDIHGRLDLLEELLDRIACDNAARRPARTTIVFLGDLIDRGPHSAEVIERLRHYRPPSGNTVFLRGNHEEILLRILGGETSLLPDWLKFGGAECARSYGVDPVELQCRDPAGALKLLRRAIPNDHLRFLDSFADTASFGPYLFVHAGVRPGVPLANQLSKDLRWIRSPFLEDESDHGRIIVHGHTISDGIDVRQNRIGLDTGAYRTGVLTALGVERGEQWFLQTGSAAGAETAAPRVAKYANG